MFWYNHFQDVLYYYIHIKQKVNKQGLYENLLDPINTTATTNIKVLNSQKSKTVKKWQKYN